jgi:hypothetical protein
MHGLPFDVRETFEPARQVSDRVGGKDLVRAGGGAEPGGEVQRASAIPFLDLDSFSRVQANSDVHRQIWVAPSFLCEPLLQVDCRTQGLSRRAEDGQGLVPSELDDPAIQRFDLFTRDGSELAGE